MLAQILSKVPKISLCYYFDRNQRIYKINHPKYKGIYVDTQACMSKLCLHPHKQILLDLGYTHWQNALGRMKLGKGLSNP